MWLALPIERLPLLDPVAVAQPLDQLGDVHVLLADELLGQDGIRLVPLDSGGGEGDDRRLGDGHLSKHRLAFSASWSSALSLALLDARSASARSLKLSDLFRRPVNASLKTSSCFFSASSIFP